MFSTFAAPAAARAPSIPAADAPQLAALGPDTIGLAKTTVAVPGRDRRLDVWLWYPARADGTPETYRRHLVTADGPPLDITTEGLAVAGAAPLPGRFPLVVISHGFGGWAGGMTYLAENLATKGYVVASIDHADGQGGSGGAEGRVRVAGSIVNRARDQQAVIAAVAGGTALPPALAGHVDGGRIALIGYSMGGFGAVATAGAPYDPAGGAIAPVAALLADQVKPAAVAGLKAVVLIAPWGGQPPYRAWAPAALAGIAVPSLWIDGDRDDVSDYANGVRWLFDHATASNRWLLTYREARHNVGGNPPPPETLARADLAENFAEPVWRSDRIAAINQHFVTAFLDRFVKGDAKHGAFLDVPTADGDTATWPDAPRGFAGAEQPHYWPGFQRRWLLGLRLEHSEGER
ncbi:MAG: alpha/beta hydrolase [Sphingomonadaceae bacterium]|nr:alpha/beta hydrolase [Sphingomonadaceae bacterium]